MSHFARVEGGIVSIVIVAEQDHIDTLPDKEFWIKTSYNTRGGVHKLGGTAFRKNFAGIGYKYDEERDAFIEPKPYNSWILNEDACVYESPTPHPTDGKAYEWNEDLVEWSEII